MTNWYDDMPEIDEPSTNYLADLAAHNDRLFARLYAIDAALHDERDGNTCPGCEGSGIDVVLHGYARDWETGEWLDAEEVPCDSCEGGLLFIPADADAWLDSFRADEARDGNPMEV